MTSLQFFGEENLLHQETVKYRVFLLVKFLAAVDGQPVYPRFNQYLPPWHNVQTPVSYFFPVVKLILQPLPKDLVMDHLRTNLEAWAALWRMQVSNIRKGDMNDMG